MNLVDFNYWIDHELNGYENYDDIPEYRNIIGEVKAKNPYYGLIPVVMPSSIAEQLNKRKLYNPISELINLSTSNQPIIIAFPSELSEILRTNVRVNFPFYLVIPQSAIIQIIESVKNYLLEWCFKLENDGILGENFAFNESEKEKARIIPQQINCYGPVITGNVNGSQIVSGNHNSNNLVSSDIAKMVDEIKKSLNTEKISDEDKNDALEILEDIDSSIKSNKKNKHCKSCAKWIKRFFN